jgi:hypothetical protein
MRRRLHMLTHLEELFSCIMYVWCSLKGIMAVVFVLHVSSVFFACNLFL